MTHFGPEGSRQEGARQQFHLHDGGQCTLPTIMREGRFGTFEGCEVSGLRRRTAVIAAART